MVEIEAFSQEMCSLRHLIPRDQNRFLKMLDHLVKNLKISILYV